MYFDRKSTTNFKISRNQIHGITSYLISKKRTFRILSNLQIPFKVSPFFAFGNCLNILLKANFYASRRTIVSYLKSLANFS